MFPRLRRLWLYGRLRRIACRIAKRDISQELDKARYQEVRQMLRGLEQRSDAQDTS